MAIILDWKIRTTTAQCEHTGEAFADEEDFYTCIFDDPESDGFIRKDYSVASWKEIRASIDPAPFSFWRSTYKAPVVHKEKDAIQDTSAEGMLKRMMEENSPHTENARYILALMLERKKTFIQVDAKEAETTTLLFYEHKDTGDVYIIADPGLHLGEIEEVQREVVELLASEENGQGAASTQEPTQEQEDSGPESEEVSDDEEVQGEEVRSVLDPPEAEDVEIEDAVQE